MKSHLLFSTLMAATALVISQGATAADQQLTTGQVEQVKGVVHDYLVTNPQVLVEASQSLQKQEMVKTEQLAKDAISKNADALFADPMSPVAGNPKGNVTMVEFFDYQCPHCKDMKVIIDKLTADDANLRVVYKELPIFGATSREASSAALAAVKQGNDKYMKFHNALLAATNPLNKDKVMQIAKSVGLDTTKLAKDMTSSSVQKEIDDNFQLAQALNLMGTPTFIMSKWRVGAKNNDVKNAIFLPGTPTADELKAKLDSINAS